MSIIQVDHSQDLGDACSVPRRKGKPAARAGTARTDLCDGPGGGVQPSRAWLTMQCSCLCVCAAAMVRAGDSNHIVFTHAGESLLGAGGRLSLQVAIPLS